MKCPPLTRGLRLVRIFSNQNNDDCDLIWLDRPAAARLLRYELAPNSQRDRPSAAAPKKLTV